MAHKRPGNVSPHFFVPVTQARHGQNDVPAARQRLDEPQVVEQVYGMGLCQQPCYFVSISCLNIVLDADWMALRFQSQKGGLFVLQMMSDPCPHPN